MQSALATRQELPLYGWRSPELGTVRRVKLPEGDVNVYERGKGPALVFSHGWLANANLWRHRADTLAPFPLRRAGPAVWRPPSADERQLRRIS